MKMFKAVLLGMFLFVGMMSVNAQDKVKSTPAQRSEKHTTKMTKELGLSDDQKAKVQEINLGIAMKNDAVRNNEKMTAEQKKSAIEGNREARLSMLKGVLSADQYEKVEAHHAEMKAKKEAKKEEIKKKKKAKAKEELEEL